MEWLYIDQVGVFRSDYKPHVSKEFFNGYSWAYFIALRSWWLQEVGTATIGTLVQASMVTHFTPLVWWL